MPLIVCKDVNGCGRRKDTTVASRYHTNANDTEYYVEYYSTYKCVEKYTHYLFLSSEKHETTLSRY